ncbi:hypothetical protein GIB67_013199 [Kingdonia uniflora]|uniref:30S ribosomal protein S16, chloroplastic n=1 Tax=Kingdonia uniflora TaxID=39325 RepID=A0A7J7NQQ4_9MAGN|nr:hypothetical protein GIB67_013199 [Kingdonia uniflora]
MTIHLYYFHSNRRQEGSMEKWWFYSEGSGITKSILVRDSNGENYSIYFDIENKIFEIDNDSSFLSELEGSFSSYKNDNYINDDDGSKSDDHYYDNWNNHINSCIDSYLRSEISRDCSENVNSIDSGSSCIRTSTNESDFNLSPDLDTTLQFTRIQYSHLWVQCENCYGLNYKTFFKAKLNICEECGYHLKMNSSDRIELLIDPGTWYPMDEDMVSIDPIEFHSEEEPYKDRIDSYQRETGLTEAVQTGIGELNGIPIAMGVMDFQFIGGSMGSVVGEKMTRLIEYATNESLPVIIVCASGGARMQEGSLSKRVIEETLKVTVLEEQQETEYLFEKGLFYLILPRNLLKDVLTIYQIVAIDVRSRREGRDLRKVGFYDPIKNQTYLNVPAILYFLEKGAQPTGIVHDISKKAEVFKELRVNQTK